MTADLTSELDRRATRGDTHRLSVKELTQRFADLGYKLDRTMDCRCTARWVSGPDVGESYPCITTGVKETDTGMSAFHFASRRDANFRAMQALRSEIFAVTHGAILEV
jgi:hypothetical protein